MGIWGGPLEGERSKCEFRESRDTWYWLLAAWPFLENALEVALIGQGWAALTDWGRSEGSIESA